LEKEVAKYDAADSDSEAGDSDIDEIDSEEDENDGDKEGDAPVDTDIDAARNAADDELIDEFEDGEKCTGSQLDDEIELPPLTVEERKQARVLLSKASDVSFAPEGKPSSYIVRLSVCRRLSKIARSTLKPGRKNRMSSSFHSWNSSRSLIHAGTLMHIVCSGFLTSSPLFPRCAMIGISS
jgi:hypothetical protein